jgi:hypothetical protein
VLIDDTWMQKTRGQVRINFDAKLKAAFDAECETQHVKPGQLATAVMVWYMRQPEFMKNVVHRGLSAVPDEVKEDTARAIANHLLGRVVDGSTKPKRVG